MYGRVPDSLGGGIVPLNVDASGNMLIGSDITLNVSEITPVNVVQPNPALLLASVNLYEVNGTTVSLGQKTMTASFPVVIASNQSAVPISATALPLPTGAATSALQTTGNTALTNIEGYLAPGQATMNGSVPVTIASNQSALAITAAALPLPTGAATSALQTTINTSIQSIVTELTHGQATMAASVPVTIASNQSALAVTGTFFQATQPVSGTVAATQSGTWVVTPESDVAPATQNVTTQDLATVTTVGANGQAIYTGTPTAGSAASFVVSTKTTISVQATGSWSGTLQLESSMDGGVTWSMNGGHQKGVAYNSSSFTANFECTTSVAGCTNFRVRALTAIPGTATITILESVDPVAIYLLNSPSILDGSGTSTKATVLPGSTAATTANTALVVTLSPNSALPIGSGTIGTVNQGLPNVTADAWPITRAGGVLNTNQVTIANTPTLIVAANANRKRLVLVNMGTTNVYFGGAAVSSATGQFLVGVAGYPLPVYYTGAVYGITASGSQVISYQEEAS